MMFLQSQTPRRGFSLIEVVVSFAILTAGLLSVLAVFPMTLRGQSKAELLTIAASLAQMKAEEIRRDDSVDGDLVQAIIDLNAETEPIVCPGEQRLTYSFWGRSLRYQGLENDPRATEGVARVIIRLAPDYNSEQDVVYELRFSN